MVVWRSGCLVIMEEVKRNKVVFEDACVISWWFGMKHYWKLNLNSLVIQDFWKMIKVFDLTSKK
jgi:hypothetical protein